MPRRFPSRVQSPLAGLALLAWLVLAFGHPLAHLSHLPTAAGAPIHHTDCGGGAPIDHAPADTDHCWLCISATALVLPASGAPAPGLCQALAPPSAAPGAARAALVGLPDGRAPPHALHLG